AAGSAPWSGSQSVPLFIGGGLKSKLKARSSVVEFLLAGVGRNSSTSSPERSNKTSTLFPVVVAVAFGPSTQPLVWIFEQREIRWCCPLLGVLGVLLVQRGADVGAGLAAGVDERQSPARKTLNFAGNRSGPPT